MPPHDDLSQTLAAILGYPPSQLAAVFGLTLVRVLPISVLAPFVSLPKRSGAPVIVRAGITLALAAVLTPIALSSAASASGGHSLIALTQPFPFLLAAMRELTVGLLLGLAIGLPLHAMGWSGQLIDTWRGASNAQSVGVSGESTSPLGAFMFAFSLALFFALGGHRLALMALADAWSSTPVASAGDGFTSSALGAARLTADALALAVSVAAPAAVALLLLELGMGLVGRTAPQIPVFFASMPLRAATGIAMLLLSLSATAALLPDQVRAFVHAASRLVG